MINQREKIRIEKIVKGAREFLTEEIPRRQEECEKHGHKEISWRRYIVTSGSSYDDKVSGICRYCLTPLERNLNEEEIRDIRDFFKSMRKPI